ncbi:MFS transporter [Dyadobacter psychrophilus]|uniref:Predicted arabinose efflux permease, MFS family n=1 Tax=Dyadobacter psychrophilus TaxID=651661 RepID=A0A1T5GCE7_9BACT|nr:MFS transporter [Dyadobacter psychrophilus]SKC06080.1 Predicted arabinose efflux permease, MFS family [Dyadobacter psychrophilus]
MLNKIIESYRVSFSGLSRETWLLSLVILINRCGYMAVPFMSMYITQSLHRSIADAGLIITLFGVGSVLGGMAGGYLTDFWGFRPVQIFSLLVSGLFFVLFGLVTNFTGLCFLIVLLSFFVEAFKPANSTAVAAYSAPENLTRSYTLNRLAMNIGFGFGTSVGGILAAINYSLLFWVDGIVYAFAGALIMFLLPGAKTVPQSGNVHTPETVAAPAAGQSPWKDALFVRFLAIIMLYMICFILLFRLVPVYWKEEMHIGESTIGILLGMNGIIIALFEMILIQNLANRRPDSYYMVAGTIFSAFAFSMLVVPAIAPVILAAAAVILFTIGEMLALPYISTFVMSRASVFNRGKYSAAYSVSQSVAQIIGPAAGGYIAAHWGYNVLWVTLVVLSFSCAFGFKTLFQGKMGLG